ncbi:hypothetical protein Dimus_033281, partial [Dionaea muscipula]
MTKPKLKRLRKENVISPNVGDNLKEVEEEEADEQDTLLIRGRRQLPRATSSLGAKSADSEETKSDDVISKEEQSKKRCQKQQATTGPSKRSRKIESVAPDVLPSTSEVKEDVILITKDKQMVVDVITWHVASALVHSAQDVEEFRTSGQCMSGYSPARIGIVMLTGDERPRKIKGRPSRLGVDHSCESQPDATTCWRLGAFC